MSFHDCHVYIFAFICELVFLQQRLTTSFLPLVIAVASLEPNGNANPPEEELDYSESPIDDSVSALHSDSATDSPCSAPSSPSHKRGRTAVHKKTPRSKKKGKNRRRLNRSRERANQEAQLRAQAHAQAEALRVAEYNAGQLPDQSAYLRLEQEFHKLRKDHRSSEVQLHSVRVERTELLTQVQRLKAEIARLEVSSRHHSKALADTIGNCAATTNNSNVAIQQIQEERARLVAEIDRLDKDNVELRSQRDILFDNHYHARKFSKACAAEIAFLQAHIRKTGTVPVFERTTDNVITWLAAWERSVERSS